MDTSPFRLDYLNSGKRDYLLIFPPPLAIHRELECLRQQMVRTRDEIPVYEWTDKVLSTELALEYRKIGSLLFPTAPVDTVTSVSRQAFFTGRFRRGEGDSLTLSLSGLERLLGYSERTEAKTDENPILITTGRADLDILTDLLLSSYGSIAPELIKRYSLSELLLILKQSSDRLRGAEAIREKQQERDKEAWEALEKDSDFKQVMEAAIREVTIDPIPVIPNLELPPEIPPPSGFGEQN